MPKVLKIPHSLLSAYIHQKIAPELISRMETIKKVDPAYEILFWLIKEAKREISLETVKSSSRKFSFPEELEVLLIELFSGCAEFSTKQLFIKILTSNVDFYQTLMARLSEIASGTFLNAMPEIDSGQIHMKTDEELLAKYVFSH